MSMEENTKLLIEAASSGDAKEVVRLIPVSDMKYDLSLRKAAHNGHIQCIQLLLPYFFHADGTSHALCCAAASGREECVKFLIPLSNPKAFNSEALRRAAYNGHTECVKLLLPISDPDPDCLSALVWATKQGHTEIVKLLLPVSNPKAHKSAALQMAVMYNHPSCIDLLYPISNPQDALYKLQTDYPSQPKMWGILEHHVAQEQNQKLNAEVEQLPNKPSVKKLI